MSSIYKHLSKADLKLEREKPVLIPGEDLRLAVPGKMTGIKVAIVLAFVLSLTAFGTAAYLIQALGHEKHERQTIEKAYSDFGREAQEIKSESNQYREEVVRMKEQLQKYSSERDTLKKELNRSRIEISNLEKKMKALEDSNRLIEKRAKDLQDEIMMRTRAPEAPVSAAPLGEVSGASPADASPAEIGGGEDAASGAPASTPAAAVPMPAQKQVMTVNRKFNFIVVNMGMRDGLTIGERLLVENDGQPIGTVEVEKLYDNFSAATIVDEVKNFKIEEGDLVRKA